MKEGRQPTSTVWGGSPGSPLLRQALHSSPHTQRRGSGRARPSLIELTTSQRVKQLVHQWQEIDHYNRTTTTSCTPLHDENQPPQVATTPTSRSASSRPRRVQAPRTAPRPPRPCILSDQESDDEWTDHRAQAEAKRKMKRRVAVSPSPVPFPDSPTTHTSPLTKRKRRLSQDDDTENHENLPASPLASPLAQESPRKKRRLIRAHTVTGSPNGGLRARVPASPSALVAAQKEKERCRKLREALKEVCTTEHTYWKNLLQMQSVFLHGAQSLLPTKAVKAIFSNSGAVLQHSQLLLLALRPIEQSLEGPGEGEEDRGWAPSLLRQGAQEMCQAMQSLLPTALPEYQAYCCGYELAHTTMLEWDTPDSKFHDFLRTTQRHQVLNLYDSLILPVQRVPRYQILLQAVHKHLASSVHPADQEVAQQVEDTLAGVVELNVAIDRALKAVENTKLMEAMAQLFLPEYGALFNPTQRELIKRGSLSGRMHGRESEEWAPWTLVLLDDQLLLAREEQKSKGGLLSIQHYLGFDSTFVLDHAGPQGEPGFQVVSVQCAFTFRARSKSEVISWKGTFKKTVEALAQRHPALGRLRDKVILTPNLSTGEYQAQLLSTPKFCSLRRPRRRSSLIDLLPLAGLTSPSSPKPSAMENKDMPATPAALLSPPREGKDKERGGGSTPAKMPFSPLRLLSPKRRGTSYRKRHQWKTIQIASSGGPTEEPAQQVSTSHEEGLVPPSRAKGETQGGAGEEVTSPRSRGLPAMAALRSFDGREVCDFAREMRDKTKKRLSLNFSHDREHADTIPSSPPA